MTDHADYKLVHDMRDAVALFRHYNAATLAGWRPRLDAAHDILLTGEGSSRIFPAKNMIDRARRLNHTWHIWTEGARQAAEYGLSRTAVIGLSNSGRTRETISLLSNTPCASRMAVTCNADSPLAELLGTDCHVPAITPEGAVAATKSVMAQALALQGLLGGPEWSHVAHAGDAVAHILDETVPHDVLRAVSSADTVYFSGRNTGVAEELVLKTNEIMRRKSAFLEGTYALHGIEEVMTPHDVVILVTPFTQELDRYKSVLADKGIVRVVAVAHEDTPFPTWRLPSVDGFDPYLQLAAGWRLLAAAGIENGIDIDRPVRARKVGNAI